MAPSAIETEIPTQTKQAPRKPLKSTGSLDKFDSIDITPVIGTEYTQANLVDLLQGPDSAAQLRDLAIKSWWS